MKIHVYAGLKDYFQPEFEVEGIVRNTDELKALSETNALSDAQRRQRLSREREDRGTRLRRSFEPLRCCCATWVDGCPRLWR